MGIGAGKSSPSLPVVGRIPVFKDAHAASVPLNLGDMLCYMAKELADLIKLRVLRKDYPELFRWAQYNCEVSE